MNFHRLSKVNAIADELSNEKSLEGSVERRGDFITYFVALTVLGYPWIPLSAQTTPQTTSMQRLVSSSYLPETSRFPTIGADMEDSDMLAGGGSADPALPSAPKLRGSLMFVQQVEVLAKDSKPLTQQDDGISLHIESKEVSRTAGAYNDIPRFLQTLPGVMFNTDSRNTYLVNGGNAMENLYVLDGVEIPNINQISSAGSSGGFVSMIDTDAVSSLTLHEQLYGSEYSGTLSSVLDVNTLEPEVNRRHGEVSMGYAGAGFVIEEPLGNRVETMTQFRRSIVNYLTDDIGIDGVPKYTSVLSTATIALNSQDSIKSLFLFADDALDIRPNMLDSQDPGLVNTNYQGLHSTGAATWHHAVARGANDLQLNYSTVITRTDQNNPYQNDASVYGDRLSERPVTLRYDLYRQYSRLNFQAGATAGIHALNYKIDQASGYPSPYNLDPAPVDASNISATMLPRDYAAYGEAMVDVFGPIQIQGGMRYQRWGINGSSAWMPRAGIKIQADPHLFVYGGVASYSQIPSLPVMLGIAQNIALKPIRDFQTDAGITFTDDYGDQGGGSIYTRNYTNYPVSTEFASLSLADVIDPFGLPYLYMPMTSAGTGTTSGSELHVITSPRRWIFAQANLTMSMTLHKALDGVNRLASYDVPTVANILGGVHLGRRQLLTGRYSYRTGTPYTPFLLDASEKQGREIYDLTQINSLRGGNYDRVDFRYEINLPIRDRSLKVFAGVENMLNRRNYYQYVLLPQCHSCGPYELTQMGFYPDGGVVWSF